MKCETGQDFLVDECTAAASLAGRDFDKFSFAVGDWSGLPPGCSVDTAKGNNVFFGVNSDGVNSGAYMPICKALVSVNYIC